MVLLRCWNRGGVARVVESKRWLRRWLGKVLWLEGVCTHGGDDRRSGRMSVCVLPRANDAGIGRWKSLALVSIVLGE